MTVYQITNIKDLQWLQNKQAVVLYGSHDVIPTSEMLNYLHILAKRYSNVNFGYCDADKVRVVIDKLPIYVIYKPGMAPQVINSINYITLSTILSAA